MRTELFLVGFLLERAFLLGRSALLAWGSGGARGAGFSHTNGDHKIRRGEKNLSSDFHSREISRFVLMREGGEGEFALASFHRAPGSVLERAMRLAYESTHAHVTPVVCCS